MKIKNHIHTLALSLVVMVCTISELWSQTGEPYVQFTFHKARKEEIGIRLFGGAEESTATIDWGNGQTETITLKKAGTTFISIPHSQNLKITGDIRLIECSFNDLTNIDVTHLPELRELISRRNITESIDLSKNPKLRSLLIQGSILKELDLSNNPLIDSLIVPSNKLSKLTLPEECDLRVLNCMTNPQLQEINFAACPKLEHIETRQSGIKEFDLSKNHKLKNIFIGVGPNAAQKLIFPSNNQIDTLVMPMVRVKSVDLSECSNLRYLSVDNNFELSKLVVSNMPKLTILEAEGTAIKELDLSQNKKLKLLTCNNSKISALDLSQATELEYLTCYSLNLKRLDLSQCTQLKELDCSVNPEMTELILPKTKTLYSLNCSDCAIQKLDTKELTDLSVLNCSNCQLGALDVTGMKELTTLNCSNNKIQELKGVESLTQILHLNCSQNPITTLSLEKSSKIVFVDVNQTDFHVCKLNALYESLRPKKDGEETEFEWGALSIQNEVNDITQARTSNTDMLNKKGWLASIKGDNSGCPKSIDEVAYSDVVVCGSHNGCVVLNLPSSAQEIIVYNLEGQVLSKQSIDHTTMEISLPNKGQYLISIDGVKNIKFLKSR